MLNNFQGKEIVVSIGNQQITGKNCFITRMDISMLNDIRNMYELGSRESVGVIEGPKEITINLEMKCLDGLVQLWDENYKPKIRNKKVEDCSIQELLFAIREKIKRGER